MATDVPPSRCPKQRELTGFNPCQSAGGVAAGGTVEQVGGAPEGDREPRGEPGRRVLAQADESLQIPLPRPLGEKVVNPDLSGPEVAHACSPPRRLSASSTSISPRAR